MDVKVMKLKDLHPAAYNPRVELKPGDREYEALSDSVARFGLVEPLVWNKRTKTLVSGHQRLNVLLAQGKKEAEVVVVDIDPEKEKLANVAVNKIEGDWDYEKLRELFDEMDADDIHFTGYSEEELSNLFDMDLPSFDGDDGDDQDSAGEEKDSAAEPEPPEKPEVLKEFNIFLSFPAKELAEKWLKDRGVDAKYDGTARNITIRMEGLEYGKGN